MLFESRTEWTDVLRIFDLATLRESAPYDKSSISLGRLILPVLKQLS